MRARHGRAMNRLDKLHDTAKAIPRGASDDCLDSIESAERSPVGRDFRDLRRKPHSHRVKCRCCVDFAKQIAVPYEWSEVARQKSRPLRPVGKHMDRQRVVEETLRKNFTSRADVLFVEPDYICH